MQKLSLTALSRTQLELARTATSGRSARTVHGRHPRLSSLFPRRYGCPTLGDIA